jgi:hypothetical protein
LRSLLKLLKKTLSEGGWVACDFGTNQPGVPLLGGQLRLEADGSNGPVYQCPYQRRIHFKSTERPERRAAIEKVCDADINWEGESFQVVISLNSGPPRPAFQTKRQTFRRCQACGPRLISGHATIGLHSNRMPAPKPAVHIIYFC